MVLGGLTPLQPSPTLDQFHWTKLHFISDKPRMILQSFGSSTKHIRESQGWTILSIALDGELTVLRPSSSYITYSLFINTCSKAV